MDRSGRTLHHVGIVVLSIETSAPGYARSLGANWPVEVIHDPLQFANVTFLASGHAVGAAVGTLVELVEPAGKRSPVRAFAEQGGGLHHLCYEVDSLEAALAESHEAGDDLVRVPLPAKAFQGRKIAWVRTAQHLLIEYLDRSKS